MNIHPLTILPYTLSCILLNLIKIKSKIMIRKMFNHYPG